MALLPLIEKIAHRSLLASGVKSRRHQTQASELHFYEAKGRGPLGTVVVLHGISSQASAFFGLIQKLRRSYSRVIAPDAPGHGKSSEPSRPLTPDVLRECMLELLDHHLHEPSVVFGGSLGGAVAVGYALARPERVSGLVLASPAGAAMDAQDLEVFLQQFNLNSRREALEFMGRLGKRVPWYTPILAPDLIQNFKRPSVQHFTRSVRPEDLFQPHELASLQMPVRVVWGREDRLMPPGALDFYRNHLPSHAILEEPEGIGHCPHWDDPKMLADRIVEMGKRIARR